MEQSLPERWNNVSQMLQRYNNPLSSFSKTDVISNILHGAGGDRSRLIRSSIEHLVDKVFVFENVQTSLSYGPQFFHYALSNGFFQLDLA